MENEPVGWLVLFGKQLGVNERWHFGSGPTFSAILEDAATVVVDPASKTGDGVIAVRFNSDIFRHFYYEKAKRIN